MYSQSQKRGKIKMMKKYHNNIIKGVEVRGGYYSSSKVNGSMSQFFSFFDHKVAKKILGNLK